MPAPQGTLVNLNIIQKRIGRLKNLIQRAGRNSAGDPAAEVALAKTLAADILTDYTAQNTAIQAMTTNANLSADPTLDIDENP